MGCEFKGSEYHKGKASADHVRDFCTLNDLGCLVDEPMGHLNCTRRAWALLQGCEPGEAPIDSNKRKPRKVIDARQLSLG
jgi:hypothetical protein